MQRGLDQFKAILCTAGSHVKGTWSQVKHSSVDNAMPAWKDGQLHIAESNTGKFVLVVEYRNAAMKIFQLEVKNKTHLPSNRSRAMISFRDGSTVHIMKASSSSLEKIMDIIEALKKGKTCGSGLGQIDKTSPPWVKAGVSPSYKNKTREQALTPVRTKSDEREEFTSVRRQRTPTSLQKPFSPWKSNKRKTPDDEDTVHGDVEDAENLGVSMLFTEQMDKENRYTPTRGDRQGVLQKRMKSGGSIFLESFEEKQKGMSENRRKGPNPAKALSHNFYSRGRQMTSYASSDLFSRTPSISSCKSEETGKKSTPGFLSLKSNNVLRPKFSWKTCNKPSGLDYSHRSLQGFANLGNTCYMNAILQSLLGLQCFIQDLQHPALIKTLPKSSLYRALARLLYAKQSNRGSTEIEFRLQNVKAAISATATRFSGFMQHDAHEFLCQCLDQLKEDVEKVNNPKSDKDDPSKEAKEATSPPSQVVPSNQSEDKPKFTCPVSQNFELEVEHSILCQECGEEVSKKETFNDLSLDLPRTNEVFSLQTALDSFCASEKLEYVCAKCDCKESRVNHKFTKLPRVLVLHLKRYTYDCEASADGKLRLSVVIPRFLTLAFHTTKNTAPPPPRSNHTPATHVPLSPVRDNLVTPFNHSSPDVRGDGGSIRKKLDYDSNRSGFKFNRERLTSDSARKASEHYISRFESDVASESKLEEESKDVRLKEMDEDQQLALALELSRQEAEASLERRPNNGHVEDFTDEELVQTLNDTMEAEERKRISKDEEEESDDELPVGLSEDPELSDLEQALQLSKRTHQEELKKQNLGNGGGMVKPLTNVGLLGGARSIATSGTCNCEKCNVGDAGDGTCRREKLRHGQAGGRHIDGEGTHLIKAGGRLLGGAKKYQQQCVMSAIDEPMDTEDDQPLAFSLDNTDEEDPTQPRMWDTDPDDIMNNKLKEMSNNNSFHVLPAKDDSPSDRDRNCLSDDALHHLEKDTANSPDVDEGKRTAFSSTPDHGPKSLAHNASHRSGSVSCSKARLTDSPMMSGVLKSETKDNENIHHEEDEKTELWRPYRNSRKNIFQEFAPAKVTSVRKDGQQANTKFGEDGAHREEEGEDGMKAESVMSYEEMKAKEEEDIRKATELSMQDAEEISEREAAEILRAQEMSLQDFHQTQGMTVDRSRDSEESRIVSPVYTKEQADMLSKHSEVGHLSNAYRLVSIVSHIGSTSMTGHYVSDVYDVDKKCWLSYDDSTVMKRDERSLREERKRTGYIFFYQAKDLL